MIERFKRTQILFGKEAMERLYKSHVLVVGVGGVGGYVCEMLARSGVGQLTIVDFDVVSKSNINRQIIALTSTIGLPKVEVMKNRIQDINPSCKIDAKNVKLSQQNVDEILSKNFDYVVDAIDEINAKIVLIKRAQSLNLKIISAMGAGNRTGVPSFKICDVYKTYNDGLAKKLRKLLKENAVEKLDVAFSDEKCAISNEQGVVGSTSYSPSMCGSTIAAFVVNELVKTCINGKNI